MKFGIAIFTFLIFTFSVKGFANSIVTTCHGCSDGLYKIEAENQRVGVFNQKVYVFDSVNRQVRLFKIYNDVIDDGIDVVRAEPDTPPIEVINAYNDYLNIREDFLYNLIENHTNSLSSTRSKATSGSTLSSRGKSCNTNSLLGVHRITDSSIDAFSFIRYSADRRVVYNHLMNNSPYSTQLLSSLNHIKDTVNTNSPLKLKDLNITLKFSNGSSIQTYVEPLQNGLTPIINSGVDTDCNTIPQTKNEMTNGFKFSSAENMEAMKEHLWFENVKWVQTFRGQGQGCTYEVRCKSNASNGLECTAFRLCK